MKNKILISTLILMFFAVVLCSQVFAANDAMNSAGNAIKSVGNSIGNAAVKTKDAIVGGTQNLANGAANLGNDAMNTTRNVADSTTTLGTTNANYTATRTATNNGGLFGMSTTMSTWLILGIVGAVIVGLIWYYGAQYEHKNYSND